MMLRPSITVKGICRVSRRFCNVQGRDMQVGAYLFSREVPYFHDRGMVVVDGFPQSLLRFTDLRKGSLHLFVFAVQKIPRHDLLIFNGFIFQIFGNVALPVEELASYRSIRQQLLVPVSLKCTLGDVQQQAHIQTIQSSLQYLRVEFLSDFSGEV